ncbi:putative AIM2 family protein [Smittium mucronatum]|uniref:Putative AIM2 family protein n=1 Tax=Smittium mucronatum TaxID=133383 RepID=A0A1R0GUW0_9FUNG|nr:putative AIM2 family protein [Smittium mucronatum]
MTTADLPFPINDKSVKVEYNEPSSCPPVLTTPVQAEYKPTGNTIKLDNDLDCYVTGSADSKAAIIYCYDIFLFSNNIYQAADIFGKAGYRVIVPGYWKNEAFPEEFMNEDILMKALEVKTYYKAYKKYINAAKNYLVETEKIEKVFIVGECLGGRIAMSAAEDDGFYIGLGLIHPSLVTNSDIEKTNVPIVLFGASDDPDYTRGIKSINKKSFGKLNNYQVYHDVAHGYASSVADLKNPAVVKRLNDTFGVLVAHLDQILESYSK